MKILIAFLIMLASPAFADYSYKVTEFVKIKNSATGQIIAAAMTVRCDKDGVIKERTEYITREEITAYEADSSYVKTIAERISESVKAVMESDETKKTETIIEKESKENLDAIVIDSMKVK